MKRSELKKLIKEEIIICLKEGKNAVKEFEDALKKKDFVKAADIFWKNTWPLYVRQFKSLIKKYKVEKQFEKEYLKHPHSRVGDPFTRVTK